MRRATQTKGRPRRQAGRPQGHLCRAAPCVMWGPPPGGARQVLQPWPSWKQDFRGCVIAPRGRGETWAPHPSSDWPLVSGGRAMAWTAAAASGGARGTLSAHTLLFDLPPALLGELCAVLDSCDGALGWRGLGERGQPLRRGGRGGGRRGRGAHAQPGPPPSRPGCPRSGPQGAARPPGSSDGEAALSSPRQGGKHAPRPEGELPPLFQRHLGCLCKVKRAEAWEKRQPA